MAWFPFTDWNKSFFGDMTRWFESSKDSHHDPVWKSK
jgi:hypothetical protein